MVGDEEIHNALLAIHSRLDTIQGRLTLVARAEKAPILEMLREVVRDKPLLGQTYLLLDGDRIQRDVVDALAGIGVDVHEGTVSKTVKLMVEEYGLAEPCESLGVGKIYRKDRDAEGVLNLSRHVRRWLVEDEQPTDK